MVGFTNGGFETGNLTGWTIDNTDWSDPADKVTITTEASAAAKYAGTYGGRLDATWIAADQFYGEAIIWQTVTSVGVLDGDIYDFWVKVPTYTADGAYVELRVYLWDGAEVSIELWSGSAIQDWEHVQYTIDDGVDPIWSGGVKVIVTAYAEKWTATTGGEIQLYVDDFTFTTMGIAEFGGNGDISISETVMESTLEFGGNGAAGARPPVMVLASIDALSLSDVGLTVSKRITDSLWRLEAEVIGQDSPAYFTHMEVNMTDHASVSHTVFYGFVTQTSYAYKAGSAVGRFSGYDYGWYLAQQMCRYMHIQPWTGYKGSDYAEVSEDTNPKEIICRLLGWTPDGSGWQAESGIEPYNIMSVTGWGTTVPKRLFTIDETTSKLQVIQQLADHCHFIFTVKWKKYIGDDFWTPIAYFIPYDQVDAELDVPAPATITLAGNFVETVDITDNNDERRNFVRVSGMNVGPFGVWDVGSAGTPAQEAGEELRIEYDVKRPDLESAAECQTIAEQILAILDNPPAVYKVKMHSRVDLDLYQKVKFTGFDMVPEDWFRIIGIEYHRDLTGTWVMVECVADGDFSSTQLLRTLVASFVNETQAIARQTVREEVPEDVVGEITAIDSDEATITLEKDGRSIKARIVDP